MYFLCFLILITFDFYAIQYAFLKIIKGEYYESMQLDDLNKISLVYNFSYTLVAMYKISLNDK